MTARGARGREWSAVALAFAALAAVALGWIAVDRQPPAWDHANHLERAVLCARDLAAANLGAVFARSAFYPPVVPCLAGVAARVLRSDVIAATLVMLGFLALGMAAVYALARARIDGTTGVLAAVVFGSAPFVVFNTVRFQLDLPLASIVAVALWMIVRTEGFSRRGWSLAFGLVVALGLLIKPPFPVYVAPAVVWAISGKRRSLANLALAVTAAIVVSLAWYGPRLMGMPAQIANRSFKQAAESGHPEPFSWAALSIYPVTLPTFFGAAATVLFVAGLVVAARRRYGLELVSALVPFALFLMIQNKNARYTLPILPMASIVAALAVTALRGRARTAVTAAVLVVAAFQVSATAFAVPPVVGVPGTRLAAAVPAPPEPGDWRHREIFDAIARHARGRAATVSIVPNHPLFSTSNFRYYAVRDGRPLRIVRAWDEIPVGVDYMVVKTGDVGPPWTEVKSRRAMARLTDDPDFARFFPIIAELPLPDGSLATVRARGAAGPLDTTPAVLAAALERAVGAGLGEIARDVEGLTVHVAYDAAILGGQVRRLEVAAARATVGELKRRNAAVLTVTGLRLVMEGLVVNPWSVQHGGRFEPLDAERLRLVAATIGARDLQTFLHALKGFARMQVRLDHDALAFAMDVPGPDVSGRVHVTAAARPFALEPEGVRLGGVAVPGPLVSWVFRNLDPAPRLADRLPFPVEIARVRVSPDAIRIGE